MMHILIAMPYSFLVFQIFISVIVLLVRSFNVKGYLQVGVNLYSCHQFVMYHAQTINGGRFAEMRLNDHLLASLILFHDFIIIFLLTFYAQIVYRVASRASTTTGSPLFGTWPDTTPIIENIDEEFATEEDSEVDGEPSLELSPDEESVVFF